MERHRCRPGSLRIFYLHYNREEAKFVAASGTKPRNASDVYYAGKNRPIVFDVAPMAQLRQRR